MYETVKQAIAELRKAVEGLDPEVLHPDFAVNLLKAFSEGERICAAGKTLAARQVEASGVWRKSGESSAAQWMAKTTGEPVGSAISSLETARRVSDLPETEKALRSGKLSAPQANQIASAASAVPDLESDLLNAAQSEGFSGLKQRCERIKASALPDESARHAAIHRSRRLRHWTDAHGAFRLDASLSQESGGILLAALAPLRDKIFAESKKLGERCSFEACSADALLEMAKHVRDCEEAPRCRGPKALVHVRVDHSALTRGNSKPGETCEIAGLGPIPVATARKLASDAFLAAIVTDGFDVNQISHIGRTIPARLRTALDQRDQSCVIPRCNNKRFLEIDHVVPLSERGPTSLANLAKLCGHHHDLKTYHGYKLGGRPGAWTWEPPERTTHPPD